MSLLLATLLPGLFLLLVGAPLLLGSAGAEAALKSFPRSQSASWVLFGGAAVWFLHNVWHLSPADFGEYRAALFIGFAAIAILSFKCVPDFLAVRGACVLVLLCAMPLLDAAYMEYDHPQRLFMVSLVYVVISLAIWLGAQPWRARDVIEWAFARPGRGRVVGGSLALYGLLLCGLAFTY
jgi:hypothetical protein